MTANGMGFIANRWVFTGECACPNRKVSPMATYHIGQRVEVKTKAGPRFGKVEKIAADHIVVKLDGGPRVRVPK